MRLGKIALAVTLGLALTARADDNVMVDLSVLDSLDGSYIAPMEPLFPVLPKKPKPAPKKIKKKVKPVVAKTKASKVKSKHELKVKIDKSEPKIEVKAPEPVVVVDVEPLPEPQVTEVSLPQPVAKVIKMEPIIAESAKKEAKPVAVEPLAEPEIKADKVPALLVEEAPAQSLPAENAIIFAPDVDELSTEQMAAIDTIIGRFKDTNTNKIAIYSYNLDDGVDSFRKKRLSLNRAINIRGYLFQQGYKNFSIKVININADSDKINMVELEEI